MTKEEILRGLGGFTGTECYHRPTISKNFLITDGVKWMIDTCRAYWLMDIISSWQPKVRKNPRLQDMQFWRLKVKDKKGIITCEYDKDDIAETQHIEFTDFPLDEILIYVQRNERDGEDVMVACLPSEY